MSQCIAPAPAGAVTYAAPSAPTPSPTISCEVIKNGKNKLVTSLSLETLLPPPAATMGPGNNGKTSCPSLWARWTPGRACMPPEEEWEWVEIDREDEVKGKEKEKELKVVQEKELEREGQGIHSGHEGQAQARLEQALGVVGGPG